MKLLGVVLAAAFCGSCTEHPARSHGIRDSALEAAEREADSLYTSGEFDRSRIRFEDALGRARAVGDTTAEARVLTSLGLAARNLGRLKESRALLEASVRLKTSAGMTPLLPRSYNALGLLAWWEGRLDEATEWFERTIAVALDVDDPAYVVRPAVNLGLVYIDLGEFERARDSFLPNLDRARRMADTVSEGRILINLASLENRRGDPRAALAWLDQARSLDLSRTDPAGDEALLGQQVDALSRLGAPGRAIAALDSALERARRLGLREAEAANLSLLARILHDAGEHRRALDLFEGARSIEDELGLEESLGTTLRNLAVVHAAQGHLPLAHQRAGEALRIHSRLAARFGELLDRVLLAELAHHRADAAAADVHLAAADSLADELAAHSVRIEVGLVRARIAADRAEPLTVLSALDQIADDLAVAGYATEWEVQSLRARALASLGRLEDAAAAGWQAVTAVEHVRGALRSGMLRTTFVARRSAIYSDLVDVLLALERPSDAFSVADRARGRTVLEHTSTAAGPEELLGRIAALADKVREYEEAGDPTGAAEIGRRLQQARRTYEIELIRAAESTGEDAPLTDSPDIDTLGLRASLQPHEALIEYLIGDDELFTFVLRADSLHTFRVPIGRASLHSRTRLVRGLVEDPGSDPAAFREVLESLHDALIGPALRAGALEGARRLILVPHGDLAYLPFAALRDAASGRHLATGFVLVSAPSAAAFGTLRWRGRTDPVRSPGVVAFAPLPARLPASRAEVQHVARAVHPARTWIGPRASEPRLRDALAERTIVHVASHAALNVHSPLFSHVALADSRADQPSNDGRLEIHEVLGLEIASPLVFLSGCETGAGLVGTTAFEPGEDYATLSRAFLIAGASSVIATLWPVTDAGAAAFAGTFYDRLVGSDAAEALAAAQRVFMADGRYGHPHYWAGYRITGDPRPLAIRAGR